MHIENASKRLQKFWGKVDAKHVSLICKQIDGKEVLDMGSGYGTTTAGLTRAGFKCTGIDFDNETVEQAKKMFPECTFLPANAEALPFADKTFDVVILRDALHHFFQEADFEKVKHEILRVSKDKSTLIFFDPNVNFLLKVMRKLSSHKDAECNYESAVQIMKELNYQVTYTSFNTLYSLPLSGGYVGLNFVPNIKLLHSIVIGSENFFERLVNAIGLGRYLSWRYLVVGKRS